MTGRNEALAKFYCAALEWSAGEQGDIIVDAAADALVDGLDTPALRYLAGATQASANDDALEWAPAAIDELGLILPERLSSKAIVAAARLYARRFLRDRSGPRALAIRMQGIYVESGYSTELEGFAGLDDWHEMFANGTLDGDAAEADRATIRAAEELVARQMETSIALDDQHLLTEAGEILPSWSGTQTWLLELTEVPAATANGRLLRSMPEEWRARVVARTSHADLLFTHPADAYPFPRSVRVSWRDDVYSMELHNMVGIVTGDKCYEPNAALVLSSLLAQLVGGETDPPRQVDDETRLIDQRLRNQIIDYLELASSLKPNRRVGVPQEVVERWPRMVHDYPWKGNAFPSACSDEEVSALENFDVVWERLAPQLREARPSIRNRRKSPAWAELRDAASTALTVLKLRGRIPESREVGVADLARNAEPT